MLPSMKRLCLLLALLTMMSTEAQTLKTRWSACLTQENVHREYPRPQMVRKNWTNLNGLWHIDLNRPDSLRNDPVEQGTILVPFPPESQLSGFHHKVEPGQRIHYSRKFKRPTGDRVLLHFGALDWLATVFVNDKQVGMHEGGYDPFSFDITEALN